MTWGRVAMNKSKAFRAIHLLFIFFIFVGISGCASRHNNLVDYQDSVDNRRYAQAAVRLERCINSGGTDSGQCRNIFEILMRSGLPIADAIKKRS